MYPLAAHLLDTAAATAHLFDEVLTASQRTVLMRAGMDEAQARQLAMVLAAWHDIGKATPCFQVGHAPSMVALTGLPASDAPPGHRVAHATAGFAHLVDRFVADGFHAHDRGLSQRLAQVVGGHHGVFPAAESISAAGLDHGTWHPRLEGWVPEQHGRWRATRQAVSDRVERALFGAPWQAKDLTALPVEAASLLTGIVITADWLMSQTTVIDAGLADLPTEPEALTAEVLAEHYARADSRAAAALADSGLVGPCLRYRSFTDHFPGYTARGPQVTAAEVLPDLVHGPGIFVMMAPTGDGKTEAALHAASVLAEVSGASGVAMALPTMATTDAMYLRTRDFTATAYGEPTRLALMHSLASLNEEYVATEVTVASPVSAPPETAASTAPAASAPGEPPVTDALVAGEGAAEVTAWMRGSKRAVLAPSSVGTIDQVLTMALRGKWQPLRLLGHSRKVVVVDEAHSYDAYMQALLRRSLAWLGATGTPVILLSATLSGRMARSLVGVYAAGSGARLDADREVPSYPGWMHFDTATQVESIGAIPVTDRGRTVGLRLSPYAAGGRGDTTGLVDVVLAEVTSVARGEIDGNVLVVVNTVREAVAVFDALREVAADSGTPVHLMHSRFPVRDRVRHAREVNTRYGKHSRTTGADGTDAAAARPVRSILVATQVVEQSLDLDMDAVISDLAPMAMLIQRAGRGHRHQVYSPTPGAAPVPVERPAAYPDPTLTVLAASVEAADSIKSEAPGTLGCRLADRDRRPYDHVLLERTWRALGQQTQQHPAGIRVPEDVQRLIDDVYDTDFTDGTDLDAMTDRAVAAAARAAEVRETRMLTAADIAAIPTPQAVQDLTELTSPQDAEEQFGRLGARYDLDTVTVLPIWQGATGWWLDAAMTVSLPLGLSGRVSQDDLRSIIGYSITVPASPRWTGSLRQAQEGLRPAAWTADARLAEILLVQFTYLSDEKGSTAAPSSAVTFYLHSDRGLASANTTSGDS